MKKPNPCGAARCEAPLRSLGRLDTKPGLGFVDSFFDEEVEYIGPVKCYSPQAKISAEGYRARGLSFVAVKIDDADVAEWQSVTATFYGVELVALDMVDLDSGTIYSIDDLDQVFLPLFSWDNEDVYSRVFNLPLRGSPVLVVDRRLVPIAFDWQTMKPAEIVDCLYKPGITNFKSLPERADWMDMPTKDFLPFVDKYGQTYESLYFFKCQLISDFSPLAKLKNLKAVRIYWNIRSDGLWDMTENESLTHLDISDSKIITRNLKLLKTGKNLKYIKLSGGMFEKYPLEDLSVFENMQSLESLTLYDIKLGDRNTAFLKTLPNLTEFHFDAGMFTTEEIAYMCARYPHIHGRSLCAYNEMDAALNDVRVCGYRKPGIDLPQGQKRLDKDIAEFNALVEKYKTEEGRF